MEDLNYNSLAKNLIEQGILKEIKEEENFFKTAAKETSSPKPKSKKPKKHINQYDLELLKNGFEDDIINDASFKIIQRFINFKQNLMQRKNSPYAWLFNIESFLFAFFPKLYKIKLAKDAMAKLKELDIDTKKLLEKTVPYGEKEARYENLIKYINYANEIQAKLKKH